MRNPPKDHFDIHSTRACIDNSERNSLTYCIFALAIGSSIPGANRISVDTKECRFSWKGYRYIFPTPEKSSRIAHDYDTGLLGKKDIQPWHDSLKDRISAELIQHRRPRKVKAARKKTVVKKTKSRGRRRCTRWNGMKVS